MSLAALVTIPLVAIALGDEPQWDVNNPPLPMRDVPIDVDEGTWLDLDVSPDGKEIAFNLLGDIYVIPIDGGDAKPLTSGVAWDMQPAYSPDGTRIAFTSDRGGGDNLWVMNRDGSEPKAVTKENYRLVNEPAWEPSGQWIVGRKHFVSHRSLGAGEMWLYHVAGSEGVQMTTKPNDQKDVGEPAFSPDGRYLYFSLDATPGTAFEYSKDSNAGIYAINRLDRQTGETITLVSGPGGACRPTPSPDGKSLAYVHRVRFETTLWTIDLESGSKRQICGNLERDMQETWAIHGVYPRMEFLPDGKSIVFYAHGRIHRVDVGSGEDRMIPFHVKDARKVSSGVRFPHEVAPDTFKVKAIQSVTVAPDGSKVAYQALGHVYVRDLPSGVPKRLTKQSDDFEFFPSFSRDSKSIVYTTWNDDELGAVRVAPADGIGESRAVTTKPGMYVEPVFAPDGSRIVYRKVAGGRLTSPRWGLEPGVYVIPAAGGEGKLVTKSGEQPRFGAASDRVYLEIDDDSKEPDRHILVSIGLDGKDQRTHAASEDAVEFTVSPDGKWLGFVERYQAYVAAFPETGREMKVGPTEKGLPIARVSKDAGEFVEFSGDSKSLHWALGPELFTRPLTDAFAFLAGAPSPLPSPPETGVDITFDQPASKPSDSKWLTHARIITMKGDEVIADGAIRIEGNRIAEVVPMSGFSLANDQNVFDMRGKTIVPGIIDVHAHGGQAEQGITPQNNWVHYANLAFGVTTIHDPSNNTHAIFASSELQRAGMITSPRTFSTGTILYGAYGASKVEIETLDDARRHLKRLKAIGAFSVKSYNQPRRDQRQKILAAARELEMMVVPEGGSTFQHNLTMVVDGHTGIEHSLPVERVYHDVVQLWKGSDVGYTPTLVVAFGGTWGENYWYDTTNVWENERLVRFVPREIIDPRSRRRIRAPLDEYNHFRAAAICKALVDAGEHVQLGAHGQLAGLGAHWELAMFTQGGLTPLQALRAATFDGARYIGLDHDLGSIEPGKLADLLVIDGDPLAEIKNSQKIALTIQNGVMYEAASMIGPRSEPPHFFFETDGAIAGAGAESCACEGS